MHIEDWKDLTQEYPSSRKRFSGQAWIDFHMMQTWSYNEHDCITREYGKDGPIVDGEPGYEGLWGVDRNEIRRHFENLQRSNITIDVPECNGSEMKLLGCKNSSLAGKKSAYVGLSGNHNKISLEIVNGSGMNINKLNHELFKGRSYYFGRHKGYNVVLWRQGKTLYSLTSTMNRRDLMRVASESIHSYNK